MKKKYTAPLIQIQSIEEIEYCVFCGVRCPCAYGCAYSAGEAQVNECLTVLGPSK
ncbi:MAG: hypothetical protein IKB30_02340 [Clostridia bacterium]|nr:hypothetical protein [Clostridia bacterium]